MNHSLLQVALRPAQVVLLHFQFADDHPKAVQLDALKGFHALLQASQQALYDLRGVSLRGGMARSFAEGYLLLNTPALNWTHTENQTLQAHWVTSTLSQVTVPTQRAGV